MHVTKLVPCHMWYEWQEFLVKCYCVSLHEILYSEHSVLGHGLERVIGTHSFTFQLGEVYFLSRTAESDHHHSVVQPVFPRTIKNHMTNKVNQMIQFRTFIFLSNRQNL